MHLKRPLRHRSRNRDVQCAGAARLRKQPEGDLLRYAAVGKQFQTLLKGGSRSGDFPHASFQKQRLSLKKRKEVLPLKKEHLRLFKRHNIAGIDRMLRKSRCQPDQTSRTADGYIDLASVGKRLLSLHVPLQDQTDRLCPLHEMKNGLPFSVTPDAVRCPAHQLLDPLFRNAPEKRSRHQTMNLHAIPFLQEDYTAFSDRLYLRIQTGSQGLSILYMVPGGAPDQPDHLTGGFTMIRVAFYDTKPYDMPSFEAYGKQHDIEFRFLEAKLNRDTAELAKDCDVVCFFVNDTASAEVIERLHALGIRLIALRCAGYNNVDVKAAFGKIHVVHVPAYSPYAVAEHAIALLLTSVRRIHKAYNRTRDFNFSLNGLTGFDFHGKTVGVIGTGKIGRIFIDICRGFGMHVIAYDKFPAKDAGIEYVSLEELFSRSDIISLHCPLTEETRHLIDREAIRQMKKGVVLVNTSRGALIDAEALLEGIKERKVGAACLDVYEEEGDVFFEDRSGHILNDDLLSRLISMPNVIVTSHQAFLTEEALNNIAQTTVENILSFFENNGICSNELCYRCGQVEHCRKERRERCF